MRKRQILLAIGKATSSAALRERADVYFDSVAPRIVLNPQKLEEFPRKSLA